jgi:hypothetical protein
MKMAENGLLSAPNMAVGEPFNIGITTLASGALAGLPGMSDVNGGAGGALARYPDPRAADPGA